MKASKDRTFGKKQVPNVSNSTINSLDFEDDEVHTINTRAHNYKKNNFKWKFQ